MKAGSFLGLLQSPFGLLPQPQKTSGNYYLYALLVNDVVALFGVNDVMALEKKAVKTRAFLVWITNYNAALFLLFSPQTVNLELVTILHHPCQAIRSLIYRFFVFSFLPLY